MTSQALNTVELGGRGSPEHVTGDIEGKDRDRVLAMGSVLGSAGRGVTVHEGVRSSALALHGNLKACCCFLEHPTSGL